MPDSLVSNGPASSPTGLPSAVYILTALSGSFHPNLDSECNWKRLLGRFFFKFTYFEKCFSTVICGFMVFSVSGLNEQNLVAFLHHLNYKIIFIH